MDLRKTELLTIPQFLSKTKNTKNKRHLRNRTFDPTDTCNPPYPLPHPHFYECIITQSTHIHSQWTIIQQKNNQLSHPAVYHHTPQRIFYRHNVSLYLRCCVG